MNGRKQIGKISYFRLDSEEQIKELETYFCNERIDRRKLYRRLYYCIPNERNNCFQLVHSLCNVNCLLEEKKCF